MKMTAPQLAALAALHERYTVPDYPHQFEVTQFFESDNAVALVVRVTRSHGRDFVARHFVTYSGKTSPAMRDSERTDIGALVAVEYAVEDPMPSQEDSEAYHAWYTRHFSPLGAA